MNTQYTLSRLRAVALYCETPRHCTFALNWQLDADALRVLGGYCNAWSGGFFEGLNPDECRMFMLFIALAEEQPATPDRVPVKRLTQTDAAALRNLLKLCQENYKARFIAGAGAGQIAKKWQREAKALKAALELLGEQV